MPFAVFRRHQRKLLAIFAILAMFGFVLADSLPRLLNGDSTADADPVVVELKDRSIRSSEVNAMAAELDRAKHLHPRTPVVAAMALIVPQGLVERLCGAADLRHRHVDETLRGP